MDDMKKTLIRGAIAFVCILILASVIVLCVSKTPNNIHSNVVYGNSGEYATLERISAVRPPLAAPNAHSGSAGSTEVCFVCDLQMEG